MNLLPSWKTMGIWGAVLALVAYLFRDNPLVQGLLEMFTGPKEQPKEKPQAATSGAAGGGAVTEPKAETPATAAAPTASPQEKAAQVMTEWKTSLAASSASPQVQQAILQNEAQLQAQFAQAYAPGRTPEQTTQMLGQIQFAALQEASKGDFEQFTGKMKQQQAEHYRALIQQVQQNKDLPTKEKNEALVALRKESKAAERALEKEINGLSAEMQLQLALNPKAQETLLAQQREKGEKQTEQVKGNITEAVKNHKASGWNTGSTVLSICSLGLAVTGGVLTATGVGSPLGLGLIAASTCATGMAGGYCSYQSAAIHESTLGKSFALAEVALSALPIVGKGVGLAMSGTKALIRGDNAIDVYRLAQASRGLDITGDASTALNAAIKQGGSSIDDISKAVISGLGGSSKLDAATLNKSLETVAGWGMKSNINQAAAAARAGGYFNIAKEAQELASKTGLSGEALKNAEKVIGEALAKAAASRGNNVGAAAKYLMEAEGTVVSDETQKALIQAGKQYFHSGRGLGLSTKDNFYVASGNTLGLLGELTSSPTPIVTPQPEGPVSALKK